MSEGFGDIFGKKLEEAIKAQASLDVEKKEHPLAAGPDRAVEAVPDAHEAGSTEAATRSEPHKTRDEKIAAFRAQTEDLEKKRGEAGWGERQKDYKGSESEYYDRVAAEEYDFDIAKINEAIEEVKRTGKPLFKAVNAKESLSRLERAKKLIRGEVGVEPYEVEPRKPLAEKIEDDKIKGMKGPEGAPIAPAAEPAPEPKKEKESEAEQAARKWEKAFAQAQKEKREEKETETMAKKWEEALKPSEEDVTAQKWEEELKEEAQPQAQAQEQTVQEQKPEESLEVKKAVDELLSGVMAGNERVREAARAAIEARGAMIKTWLEILANKKEQEKELPSMIARAQRWLKSAVQETPKLHLRRLEEERAYHEARDAMVRTVAEEAEKTGGNIVETKGKLWNLDTAESVRLNEMKERASPHEWLERTQKLSRYFNYIPEKICEQFGWDKKTAKHVRIVGGAAIIGGIAFAGGAGAAVAGLYMGGRVARSYLTSTLFGLSSLGIEYDSQRFLNQKIKALRNERKEALDKELETNERAGAIVEAIARERAEFNDKLEKVIRRRRIEKGIVKGVLIGGLGLACASHAFAGTAEAGGVPEDSPVKPHVEIQEDSFRSRIDAALDRAAKAGKGIGGSYERILKRLDELGSEGKSSTEAAAKAVEEAVPSTLVTPKLGPSLYPETESPPSTLVEPKLGPSIYPEEVPEGKMTSPVVEGGVRNSEAVAEEVEKITATASAADAEALMTIEKGSNIWETSRKFIGHGMTEDEWRKSYLNSFVEIDGKKVPFNEMGFVKPGMQIVRVEGAEGTQFLLRDFGNEAGTNDALWEALVKEGKIKAGEPVPEQYRWLEKARGIEHHAPTPGEQAAHAAALAESRPAMTKETFEQIMRERAGGTATLKEFLGNHDAYVKAFAGETLSDQEARIADIERGFDQLRHANQFEGVARPELRADFLAYEKNYATLLADLKEHSSYREHLKEWGDFAKEWQSEKRFGFSNAQWNTMMDRWTVAKFMHVAKEVDTNYSLEHPADDLERILGARRQAVLDLRARILREGGGSVSVRYDSLGRFLKTIL